MREAEQSSPRLIPTLARHVLLHADNIPDQMVSGSRRHIAVSVRNTSPIAWPACNKSGLTLGNRWLDESARVIEWIDGRVPLPELKSGAEARLRLPITAPRLTGAMQLILDVVEEGNSWFNLPQDAPLRARVEIMHQEGNRGRRAILPIMKLWWKAHGPNGASTP